MLKLESTNTALRDRVQSAVDQLNQARQTLQGTEQSAEARISQQNAEMQALAQNVHKFEQAQQQQQALQVDYFTQLAEERDVATRLMESHADQYRHELQQHHQNSHQEFTATLNTELGLQAKAGEAIVACACQSLGDGFPSPSTSKLKVVPSRPIAAGCQEQGNRHHEHRLEVSSLC